MNSIKAELDKNPDQDHNEYIIETIFGWCGCGNPAAAGQYILAVLRRVKVRSDYDNRGSFEKVTDDDKQLQPFKGALEIMWYIMYQVELTEHVGSVPGWLTDKGTEVLEILEAYFKDQEDPTYAPT